MLCCQYFFRVVNLQDLLVRITEYYKPFNRLWAQDNPIKDQSEKRANKEKHAV